MASFRRYTNLAATIHILRSKTITLLNPANWDDKNDAYFMAEYKRYKGAQSVLALCFAESAETYHHWRVFSHGSDGVCIEFEKDRLIGSFANKPQIVRGAVSYKKIKEIEGLKSIDIEKLPFLKRYPYEDEHEYRIIYVDAKKARQHMNYPIQLNWINRIILSPWMSKSLRDSVQDTLQAIDGCSRLKIVKSSLIDSDTWKAFSRKAKVAGAGFKI